VIEPIATVEIVSSCPAWGRYCPNAEELAGVAARSAVKTGSATGSITNRQGVELSITLTDDSEQQQLNRHWRGLDQATNVLAFPAWEPGTTAPADAPLLLGDIVLAFETIAREADEQSKSFADHFSHLVVHGVLHLLGYDHATEREAAAMETLETSILATLGVADPYRGTM
jgi:probable rRNA maturation factor